jgi:hypothetical protein
MTRSLLQAVDASHVLNPTPVGDEIVRFYVEFDELVGNGRTEGALRRAVEAGRRVAIVAPSGAGKSSLIEWVLGAPEVGLASIRVPVAVENDETVTNPGAFAQHTVRTVSRYALDAELISTKERNRILRASSDRVARPGRETAQRTGLGFPRWLLQGELGREVREFAEAVDHPRSGATVVDALRYLIRLIERHDLRTVFVIDDSDTWLTIEGVKDRTNLVNGFFDRVLRMLAELPAGLVVAVHERYLAMPGYRQAEGFLETTIRVPQLPDAEALERILDHRIKAADDSGNVSDAFEPSAMDELIGYYAGAADASVRKTMQAAQRAVQIACENESDLVTEAMVEAAISDWL